MTFAQPHHSSKLVILSGSGTGTRRISTSTRLTTSPTSIDHVRAQHCCAPTCPDVNFNHALVLTLAVTR